MADHTPCQTDPGAACQISLGRHVCGAARAEAKFAPGEGPLRKVGYARTRERPHKGHTAEGPALLEGARGLRGAAVPVPYLTAAWLVWVHAITAGDLGALWRKIA